MVDELRSRIMRAVKSKNTAPEMAVRKLIYAMGFRYRIHGTKLPGSPDLVFRSRRKVIFVHGCFWHGHDCKRGSRIPRTNTEYWLKKIKRNCARDIESVNSLISDNWKCLVVWECEIKNEAHLREKISLFLEKNEKLDGGESLSQG
ncbi:DNA mismatch endonuclease Vsr [Janthinobacterium svalbardensis]|uniref:very short patch repair endonuclease n=1 Tax=Janthinobacterium svalbardensis TaxID=368607 RepID=UPI002FCD94FA